MRDTNRRQFLNIFPWLVCVFLPRLGFAFLALLAASIVSWEAESRAAGWIVLGLAVGVMALFEVLYSISEPRDPSDGGFV